MNDENLLWAAAPRTRHKHPSVWWLTAAIAFNRETLFAFMSLLSWCRDFGRFAVSYSVSLIILKTSKLVNPICLFKHVSQFGNGGCPWYISCCSIDYSATVDPEGVANGQISEI